MNYCEYFSEDYITARQRFLDAANAIHALIHTLPLTSPALDDQNLSITIAWLGSSDPSRALIHSSGLHGVEGFAGSAIQLALLEQRPSIPSDCAILVVQIYSFYTPKRPHKTLKDAQHGGVCGSVRARSSGPDRSASRRSHRGAPRAVWCLGRQGDRLRRVQAVRSDRAARVGC